MDDIPNWQTYGGGGGGGGPSRTGGNHGGNGGSGIVIRSLSNRININSAKATGGLLVSMVVKQFMFYKFWRI